MAKKKKKQESTITAIVCAEKNYGIGYNNERLLDIPDYSKRFSRLTSGGYIIMGRKTYESLPTSLLSKRICFVVTHNTNGNPDEPIEKGPNYISMDRIKEWLIKKREEKAEEKIAVIGGEQIFKELIPYCDYIQITKVFKAFENVDAYFPNLDKMREWEIDFAGDIMEYDGIKYQHRKYKNLKPVKKEEKKEKKAREKESKLS